MDKILNLLEQLYELNEQNYRVVEEKRNELYSLVYLNDFDTPDYVVCHHYGVCEMAIATFYEKYIKWEL